MNIFILVFFIFLIIVYFVIKKQSSISILKMPFWLIISYSFLFLVHLFSGISFNVGYPLRILPYVTLCLLLLLIGYKIGRSVNMVSYSNSIKIGLSKLTFLSIFGATIYLFDLFRLNTINFGFRIDDLQVSIIGVIGNVLASLGIIVWLSSLYYNKIFYVKIPFSSYMCSLCFVLGGVISAGRQAIILLFLTSLIMVLWSSKKIKEINPNKIKIKKKSFPWGILVIMSLIISYFAMISSIRSGISNIDDKIKMFEKTSNSKFSEETINDIDNLGLLSDVYVEGLFYYSHQMTRLDLFFQNYDYYPLLGLSQFHYLERRVQWLFGKQSDISWQKQEVAIVQKGGFSLHTWGTFITDYIVDFGRFGALLACLFTGVLLGSVYENLKNKETHTKVIQHCLIISGVIFSIQFSPFHELIWTFPLFFISFIEIINSKIQ